MRITNLRCGITNCYAVDIGGEYIIVDTGGKKGFPKFLERIKEENILLGEIKYVFLTHPHADHAGFLRELLHATNATLIYNEKGKARLEAGKNNMNVFVSSFVNTIFSRISTAFADMTQYFPSVKTEKYIDINKQPLAEKGVTFVELGGHTASDAGMLIGNEFFCGDVCMQGLGSTKLFPAWCENKFELMKSWEKIIAHPDIVTIHPGHGKPFLKTELPAALNYWRDKGVFSLFKKK